MKERKGCKRRMRALVKENTRIEAKDYGRNTPYHTVLVKKVSASARITEAVLHLAGIMLRGLLWAALCLLLTLVVNALINPVWKDALIRLIAS